MSKIIGIIALKLGHSLSPDIHNYWSKQKNLDFKYKKFELKENDIRKFVKRFRENRNFKGFNVTIPYKESMLHLCDRVSSRARKIGSVNLVYKKNKLIYGDNTDVVGFAKCYNSLKIQKPSTVLVVGAGGAARSILYFLNQKNIENIDVYAPSLRRKKNLMVDFRFKKFINNTHKIRKRYDLIINASSAGMVGKNKLNLNIIKIVKKSIAVIDVVYNPIQTPLLKEANQNNIKNIGGLKMLIEQAKPSYEKWTNKIVKIDTQLYFKIENKIK